MGSMPASLIAAMCSGTSRLASSPPWIMGCRVFKRPSSISGYPVYSATSETLIKACLTRMLMVVGGLGCGREIREERRLRGKADRGCYPSRLTARSSHLDFQLLDFLAQGVAVDAQPLGRCRLVALGVMQHHLDHRLLDILQHH